MVRKIPVYTPILNQGNELKYLKQCIDSNWVSSDGYFVQKFEEEFAKWSRNKYAVAVCNGTAALETGIYGLDIKKGERIHIPNNTIISCTIAPLRLGLDVRFYENADPFYTTTQENLMRCHLFGIFDDSQGYKIIDDCSQYWKPFTVQDVACYSLFANKLITAGEGGILVTNKKEIYDRCRSYRDLCHSQERFIHNDLGYNFRMSNLQAAVALAQLEQIDKFVAIKQKIGSWYLNLLPDEVTPLFGVEVPWMFLIKTKINAEKIIDLLELENIECRRYFFPLHRQPCFCKDEKWAKGTPYETFPYSNDLWEHTFYLPSGLTLTIEDVRYICECLKNTLRSIT